MPRNGLGTMNLPAGNPVVSGTTIADTWANATMPDIASELTNSIPRDGQASPTASLPMGGFRHTNVGAATARTEYAAMSQLQDGTAQLLMTVVGADTITAVTSPAISAYASGQLFRFTAVGANTGAVTLNIGGLGAKRITKQGTVALFAGDIALGMIAIVVYDGTQFQIINPRIISSDSAGNVGIGTTAPGYVFDVRGPVGIGMRVRNTASGVELATRTDATTAGLDAGNATGGMTFSLNTVERHRIDGTGNQISLPSNTPPTLGTNGQMNLTPTSNTNMRISYRGTDGVTRVGNITLT